MAHPVMMAMMMMVVAAFTMAAPQYEGLTSLIEKLSGDEEPGEVGDHEQVPYTTVQKFDDYEEREYPAVTWACTEETYTMVEEDEEDKSEWDLVRMMKEMTSKKNWKNRPSSKMFMRLFRYISGVNEQREKIEMTVPVLMEKTPHEDGTITNSMCFYLGKEHQANPPQPEEEGVTIQKTEPMTVFVHMFGGYAMQDYVWKREADKFAEKLMADGRNDQVELDSYFTAGYDSPMKFWNRRNEVMFLKKPTTV